MILEFSSNSNIIWLWSITARGNLPKYKALNIKKDIPSCQNITFHCTEVIIKHFKFQIKKKKNLMILTKAVLRHLILYVSFVLRILKFNSNY